MVPNITAPERRGNMAHFPMFVNLKGKKVLVVGGGKVAGFQGKNIVL